ncbi:MAG: beta-lactamase family protein [Deltaproteobacteria bacterium]|nr:beta-lactamase family protein [Deltaproteobacteria bacterium]
MAKSIDQFQRDFDRYIETTRTTWDVPGIAVAVVKDGRTVFIKGYGVRDLATGKKVDSHTVFQLASLSKTFASTLAGVLSDRGRLKWDAPVNRYLPQLLIGSEEQTKQITLRHILSHTTGFPAHAGDPRIEGAEGFDAIIKSFEKLKILYPPGKVFDYQNVIYSLSGSVIEKVLGMSYSEAVQSYLFWPLNMNDASLGFDSLIQTNNRAVPYRYVNGGHVAVAYSKNYYTVLPAAGVNASIADMAEWIKLHTGSTKPTWDMTGAIIGSATLSMIHKPFVSSPAETHRMRRYTGRVDKTYYGLGWRIYHYGGHNVICHAGMLNGFKSLLSFSPETHTGIVLLSNSTSPVLGIIRSYFFDQLFDLSFVDWNKDFKDSEIKAKAKKASRKAHGKKKKRKAKRR